LRVFHQRMRNLNPPEIEAQAGAGVFAKGGEGGAQAVAAQ
jgi:hypothetical protein